jgi:hypothetical protein
VRDVFDTHVDYAQLVKLYGEWSGEPREAIAKRLKVGALGDAAGGAARCRGLFAIVNLRASGG